MEKDSKIYLAGHKGLVGSSILRNLEIRRYKNIITRTRYELDLIRQSDVEKFFKKENPQYVILVAAKVGGIKANITYPGQFIYENIAIQTSVIHSSYLYDVKKLIFLGSACSYPRESPQPMKEDYLLSGYLETTNEAYAIAKIAGMKMCESYNYQYSTNFICAVPTNVYGPNDNFEPSNSHVIPALIRKFLEAKFKKQGSVELWGTGNPLREFVYVDDVADAVIFLMNHYNKSEIINIGTAEEVSIRELANIVKDVIGYRGNIVFNTSKPDGMPRKALDISKLRSLGWEAKTKLDEGITKTYEWYMKHLEEISD